MSVSRPDMCKLVEASLYVPSAKGNLSSLTDRISKGVIRLLEVVDVEFDCGNSYAMPSGHLSDCLQRLFEDLDVLRLGALRVGQFKR